MTEAEWLISTCPWKMLGFLRSRTGRASLGARLGRERVARKQRLFLAACCRRIWTLIADERSRQAIDIAERFADGAADEAELLAMYELAKRVYVEVRCTPNAQAYCAACPAVEVTRVDFRRGFDVCIYGADVATMAPAARRGTEDGPTVYDPEIRAHEEAAQADLLRDIFGSPFRPVRSIEGMSSDVRALAARIYNERALDQLAILADALQSAGYNDPELLAHCRTAGPHARGCWALDTALGK